MKKFLNVIKAVINALMTLIIIIGIIFGVLYFIGIVPYVVKSGSMESVVKTGSLCLVNKHVNYEDVKVNDIIAFSISSGEKVTHRVVEITDEGLITKGDANSFPDGITTTEDNYIGKNIFSIPKLGFFVMWVQTARGRIVLITIIIVLLILAFCTDDKKEKKKSNVETEDKDDNNKNNDDNNTDNTDDKDDSDNSQD